MIAHEGINLVMKSFEKTFFRTVLIFIERENGDIDIDTVLILPILSPQKNFPLDVFVRVFPEMILAESRFEAENLRQNTGRNVSDPDASQAFAKLARAGADLSDFMTFGPYQQVIEPGSYVARFSLKVSENTSDEMVAVLDVHSAGTGVMSRKIVKGTDFKNKLEYQAFDLEFSLHDSYPPKIHRLEFRVLFSGVTDVWVDCIDLTHEHTP